MKNVLRKVIKTSLGIYIYKNISISNVLCYKQQQQRLVNISRKAVLGVAYQTNGRVEKQASIRSKEDWRNQRSVQECRLPTRWGRPSRSFGLPAPMSALFLTLGHDITASRFSVPSNTSDEPYLAHVTLTCLPEDGERKCYISFGFQNGKKDGILPN